MHVQEAGPVTPDSNVCTLSLDVASHREQIGKMIYRGGTREEISGQLADSLVD
jgi:hypothetical protein